MGSRDFGFKSLKVPYNLAFKILGIYLQPAKTSSPSALRSLATFSSTSGTKEKEPRYRHMIGRRRRPGFPSKKTMTFPSEEDDDSPFGIESPPSQLQDVQSASLEAKSKQLYLFFSHLDSPVMYSLYKIDLPIHLPPPPTEATQTDQIMNPRSLSPILQLKNGEYPNNMSCVSLGDKLYFLGGKFNIDHPNIDEDVKNKLKNVKRDVFPRDVYIFDLATPVVADKKMYSGTRMNSGKASSQAFVADEKIYVVGSTIQMNISDSSKMKDLDLKSFAYFEVYDPVDDKWTVLRNPPIRNVKTIWLGHAVVERKALLVAWQRGKERLYCFDLDKRQWTKCSSLRSYPRNFSGSTEFVDDTLYGCYHHTIAAIAPLAEEEESEEEEEEESEEEEEEEAEEVQHAGNFFKHHSLHLVSGKMGMDAIFNFPPQLQSSTSTTLLHFGNRRFCYVRTGMPPHPIYWYEDAIEDDKKRFISIVIFQTLGETYKEDAARFFQAKFLHSAHYVVETPFPNEGFIDGCFSPSLGEKECSCYVKTGQRKFGATCKFHHPQPAGLQVPVSSLAPPVARG